MFKKNYLASIITSAVLAAGASSAHADMITGGVSFVGLTPPVLTGGSDLLTNTGFGVGTLYVVSSSLSGPGLAPMTLGTQHAFTFDPSTPVNPLWSVGAYTFDATSFSIGSRTINSLTVTGVGFINAAGYEATAGEWTYTANQNGGNFSFSSSAAAVPAPAALSLLGLGFAAMGLTSRRRRTV
jgi:hypothetical protein